MYVREGGKEMCVREGEDKEGGRERERLLETSIV